MDLPTLDLAIVCLYLVGLLLFGIWFRRFVHTEADYFLAGRSLPFWAIGMSIVVSDIGAIDFVSLSEASYLYGICAANMDWIGSMPAILLAAFVFVPYYWRAGVYSVPEYLGRRYGPGVRAVQSLAWTLFLIVNLGAIFWATSGMFDTLVGPGPWEGWIAAENTVGRRMAYVLLAAGFTGLYTISGGLAAVVYTDAVQMVIMFVGAVLILWIGLYDPEKGVGGLAALHERVTGLGSGYERHFTLFHPHDTSTPFPWTGVFFGLALVQAPAYFMGNQAIVQRTLGARDEWSAKAGTLFAGLLKFCIPVLVVLPGLLALALFPRLEDPETGFPRLVEALLPAGVRGIVFAGFLAAMMSSVDSVLTSSATLISRDLFSGLAGGRAGDHLRLGRWVTLVLLVLGVLMAPTIESGFFSGIYVAIQDSLAIIQGPTWALLLIGMFWARANRAGGFWGQVAGLGLATGLTLWQKLVNLGVLPGPAPFAQTDPFMFIAMWGFIASVVAIAAVSLATRRPAPQELRGLVWRGVLRDPEVQDRLAERDGDDGEGGSDGPGEDPRSRGP